MIYLKSTLDFSQIPGKKGKIDVCVLNPKCVTLDELYGRLDPNTMEWTDGLLSATIRSYVCLNTDLGLTSKISDLSNVSLGCVFLSN